MQFNEKLLEGLPEEDRPLAKIILFFIAEQLNLYGNAGGFLNVRDGKVVLSENLYDDVQRITGILLSSEVLIPDYPDDSLIRLTPIYNLYVGENYIPKFDVDRLRKHFPVGQKSDKITVSNLMSEFLSKYPYIDMDQIEEATKSYIQHCKVTDRPIRDANNFILDDIGTSMLWQWVEETESKKDNWRNKVE